jgi:hypothetical protein
MGPIVAGLLVIFGVAGAAVVVEADDAVYALTHLWWRGDRTPDIDPLAWDQAALERGRARVLEVVEIVIPGHGTPFRVR